MIPIKRALIFANGQIPNDDAARALIQPPDLLIAADGGARHLTRMGLVPSFLIGDLDSLETREVDALERAGTKVLRYPLEKDETDLELALREAQNQGCREIVVIGGLGGRIDQSLGNLYLLQMPALATVNARLDDGTVEALWVRHKVLIHGQPGDTLSLLPMLGQVDGILTRGLKYALHGETLYPEHTRGVSNVLEAQEVTVAVAKGALLCIHERKHLLLASPTAPVLAAPTAVI